MTLFLVALSAAMSCYLAYPPTSRYVDRKRMHVFTRRVHSLARETVTKRSLRVDDLSTQITLLAATVSAGHTLRDAVLMHRPPELATWVYAVEHDRSLHNAMQVTARECNAMELEALGAALAVCERTGASLTPALDLVAWQLRQRESRARMVRSEMAGTRATVVVLAALPLLGIVLASAVGGDSLGWLLKTLPGRVCLTVGTVLEVLGVLWVRLLVRRASP